MKNAVAGKIIAGAAAIVVVVGGITSAVAVSCSRSDEPTRTC